MKYVIINTSRFGQVEVDDSKIIVFPDGIPGFPEQQRFIVLQEGLEDTPFWWLQNTDMGELCFLAVEPDRIFPDYDFHIPDEQLQLLEIAGEVDLKALAIVTVPDGDLRRATANLKAPIVINPQICLGVQLILDRDQYPIRQPLFADAGV